MTGSLQYLKRDEQPPKTARVIFRFANNCLLAFDDQRKFGEIGLSRDVDEFLRNRDIGPDALDISLSQFKTILRKHRGAVKAILLNQKLIAGIGNLYADEILFRARMHPATEAGRLNDRALTRLFRATRYVLEKAIHVESRCRSSAEIMAAHTSRKTGQMPALRPRIKISDSRRTHFMVLRALPEATVTSAITTALDVFQRGVRARFARTSAHDRVADACFAGHICRVMWEGP